MRDPVTLPELERVIWQLLERNGGRRPRLFAIAPLVGRNPLQLRREFAASSRHLQSVFGSAGQGATFRDAITYCCLTYSAAAVAKGTKIEAAALTGGFRSKSNFIRQFKAFLGCLPSEYTPKPPTASSRELGRSHTAVLR